MRNQAFSRQHKKDILLFRPSEIDNVFSNFSRIFNPIYVETSVKPAISLNHAVGFMGSFLFKPLPSASWNMIPSPPLPPPPTINTTCRENTGWSVITTVFYLARKK